MPGVPGLRPLARASLRSEVIGRPCEAEWPDHPVRCEAIECRPLAWARCRAAHERTTIGPGSCLRAGGADLPAFCSVSSFR
jgi:hypothetical protein